ncbi:MAG: extracellular solute-binding protein [Clostridia bacterium]|nr:extracellular solute-binding protein [Clostridia bacterium]
MKRLAAVLMLCVMTAVLSACHGKKTGNTFMVPDSFDDQTPIEIVFWAKNDTNRHQVEVYQQAIDEFEKLYPNVTVNMRLYTDYNRIYNDVITNISTDTTPNVCITYPDHIATYLTGDNVVVPLDELIKNDQFGLGGSEVRFDSPKTDEMVPEFMEECRIGGVSYALPYMRSTEALYINRDFVEKLGYEVPEILTWDFVWEVSEKAMEKNEDGTFRLNGQKVLIPFIYKSTDNMMISMLKQLDAPYSTDNGEILLFNNETKKILSEVYSHGASRSFSTFAISSYPANFLNAGQCIFAVDSTAGATWMGCDAPLLDIPEENIIRFETVVRPIPQYNTAQIKMISQGPSICIFSKDNSQEVLASWLFVQYLVSNRIQINYAMTEGYLPVTLKAQRSPEYQNYLSRKGEDDNDYYDIKIEASELLMKHTADTFVTPVFNGSASLRSAAGQLIENTVKGARRKQTLNDDFLEKQFSEVRSLYRLDQIGTAGQETQDTALRELPPESWALLIAIPVIWLVIGLSKFLQRRKDQKRSEKVP